MESCKIFTIITNTKYFYVDYMKSITNRYMRSADELGGGDGVKNFSYSQ